MFGYLQILIIINSLSIVGLEWIICLIFLCLTEKRVLDIVLILIAET